MAKDWIAGAVSKPGALHRDLGVPQGKPIPAKKLAAAKKSKSSAACFSVAPGASDHIVEKSARAGNIRSGAKVRSDFVEAKMCRE